MNTYKCLGFPAPLLGHGPLRLPVVFDDGDCLALLKPPGVLVQPDSWFPRLPVLIEAIRYQAAQGKPEFANMGIPETGLWAVHDLDPECAGPVLFARHRDTAESLKEQLGSLNFAFSYEFIAKAPLPAQQVACDLPLARHERLPRMLVSHTTGKKSHTDFTGLGTLGSHILCVARTRYPRRHQILLHAMEAGLPILGDGHYARSPLPLLSRLKRDYRARADREERPLYPGPALFLRSITLEPDLEIRVPEPPKWHALCKQLAKYSRL